MKTVSHSGKAALQCVLAPSRCRRPQDLATHAMMRAEFLDRLPNLAKPTTVWTSRDAYLCHSAQPWPNTRLHIGTVNKLRPQSSLPAKNIRSSALFRFSQRCRVAFRYTKNSITTQAEGCTHSPFCGIGIRPATPGDVQIAKYICICTSVNDVLMHACAPTCRHVLIEVVPMRSQQRDLIRWDGHHAEQNKHQRFKKLTESE